MYYIFENPKTISDLAFICKTPGRLLTWMRIHIRHGGHDDIIQTPQSTFTKKVCSYLEFAWLFYSALYDMGINSYIITVKGDSKNVASFFEVEGKKLKCIVNRRTMFRHYDIIDAAIDYIDINWIRWIEWAVMGDKLVPVKPHYRNNDHEESTNARNYLLRNGLSRV